MVNLVMDTGFSDRDVLQVRLRGNENAVDLSV